MKIIVQDIVSLLIMVTLIINNKKMIHVLRSLLNAI